MTDEPGTVMRAMGAAARLMEQEPTLERTLDTAAHLAVELVGGCDMASISILRPRRGVESLGATDDEIQIVDRLQLDLDEGPCISAVFDEPFVLCPDLDAEDRWPTWAAETRRRTGVKSLLCLRLFTRGREHVGALNLFADRTGAFDDEAVEVATELAAHIAIAVVATQALDHAELALDGRTIIGQAQGIVMERYGVDAVQAFALLRRLSQGANRKIRDVALDIVTTRDIPTVP